MIVTDNQYILESTGKVIEAQGAFGFSLLDNSLRLGYDQHVMVYAEEDDCQNIEFTPEEKKEIANFAIEEWKKYANI